MSMPVLGGMVKNVQALRTDAGSSAFRCGAMDWYMRSAQLLDGCARNTLVLAATPYAFRLPIMSLSSKRW